MAWNFVEVVSMRFKAKLIELKNCLTDPRPRPKSLNDLRILRSQFV
jgi:hypothetical protein